MRARTGILVWAAAFAVVAASAGARADDPHAAPKDADDAAAAQALFDDGVKLMEAGHYADACPKLAASERLDPGAGTLLNLGTCYERNGQIASAWATYQEAESTAHQAGHDDWAARAHQHSAELEPRLQRVVVVVPKESDVPGLTIERDGVDMGRGAWGVPIPLDQGMHLVRAEAPGKKPWSTSVELKTEGSLFTVNVPALEDEPLPAPAPVAAPMSPITPTSPPDFWTTQRIIAAGVAGAGLLGVIIGTGLAVSAKSKYDDAIAHDCPNGGTQCTAQGVAEGQSAHGLAAASTALFVVGGVAIGAGAALFFVPLGGPSAEASRTALRLAPEVGPGRASLSLRGAW